MLLNTAGKLNTIVHLSSVKTNLAYCKIVIKFITFSPPFGKQCFTVVDARFSKEHKFLLTFNITYINALMFVSKNSFALHRKMFMNKHRVLHITNDICFLDSTVHTFKIIYLCSENQQITKLCVIC